MRLKVLVPSEEYRSYAGARIRYGRLAPELGKLGIELELQDIGSFEPGESTTDALLISKCHDPRSLVAAAAARQRGSLVGVDLFDDYFSQRGDSRLTRFRTWLGQLLPLCTFAFCSTPQMAEVIRRYRHNLPVHVINDPAPSADFRDLSDLLAAKLEIAKNEQRIELAWFGVGDNPHFSVGLNDLAAFSGMLHGLTETGVDVRVTVLTNERALTGEGLALVGSLPVKAEVKLWSEESERDLLGSSFACFLPVNGQPFSAAKSLNRAVTALSAGCQAISVGYPLYEVLGDLIYRDLESFRADFAKGTMRHSATNFQIFCSAMEVVASPSKEAAGIAEFFGSIGAEPETEAGPIALIQGQSPNGLAHKTVKALKGLSVASPYCPPALGFDVVFRGRPGGVTMLVSEGATPRLVPEMRQSLRVSTMVSDRKFWLVPDKTASDTSFGEEWHGAPVPFQMATYAGSMKRIRERIVQAFGPCRILLSENSQLPFSPEL